MKNLRFLVNEKTRTNLCFDGSSFKVFLSVQITSTIFDEKRLSSCYKKILQLPSVTAKLSKFIFFQMFTLNSIQALHRRG